MEGERFRERRSQKCGMLLIRKTGTVSTEQNVGVTGTVPQVVWLHIFSIPHDFPGSPLPRISQSAFLTHSPDSLFCTIIPLLISSCQPRASLLPSFRRNRSMDTDCPALLCSSPAFCVSLSTFQLSLTDNLLKDVICRHLYVLILPHKQLSSLCPLTLGLHYSRGIIHSRSVFAIKFWVPWGQMATSYPSLQATHWPAHDIQKLLHHHPRNK